MKIARNVMCVWLDSLTRPHDTRTSEYYLVKDLRKRLPSGARESKGDRYTLVRTETALPEISMWQMATCALTCPSVPRAVKRMMCSELDRQGQPWRAWEGVA